MSENSKPLVIIESPYAGLIERNMTYLRRAMRHSLRRGEAPYASHGLYTQPGVLCDDVPEERKLGIEAGYAWWEAADVIALYADYGLSKGMEAAKRNAAVLHRKIEIRYIGPNDEPMEER